MKNPILRQTPFGTSQGDNTIMEAFGSIIEAVSDNKLNEQVMASLSAEFDLLSERLEVTPIQAVVLAIIIESDMTMGYSQLASEFGISTIRMMGYVDEITDLKNRHFLYSVSSVFDSDHYGVPKEVIDAFLRNENYVPQILKKMSLQEFVKTADSFIDTAVSNESDMESLCRDISEMISINSDLSLCRRMAGLTKEEQLLFLSCSLRYIFGGKRQTEWELLRKVIPSSELRKLEMSFAMSENALLKSNLMEYGGASDFVDRTRIALTDELVEFLDAELNLDWRENEVQSPLLTSCDSVVAKEMFYNADEEEQLLRLVELLRPRNFSDIRQRLSEAGMRKGFACLFYGGPGTGKTETAMQLAKAVGRDIMRVDIASIRSKWVGDSERNIKNIFCSYYRLWRTGNPIPVLLFNEADALFGKRNAAAERSVDKMENSLQNILLEELERFEGILIATTNLTSNFDPAFERRFLYKIQFRKPDVEAQSKIWQMMIRDLAAADARTLAERYDFSGGQIENVARKQIVDCLLYNKSVSLNQLETYCRQELLDKSPLSGRSVIGFKNLH